ncbi:cupin [Burkholderia sp. SRS-W-2-2016]|uniref:cupin domain-containing protein n=1 Tax=Burkholderia sp. SRS-W-2-2016 TaxID=1926878 RepID=UPI00094AD417|nr:cupin domain-containing protein [Burkholderia sp. SRS-W-2-2016]OLL30450.1 cupin [Burkholderia sp. SRS-W-2-2016]
MKQTLDTGNLFAHLAAIAGQQPSSPADEQFDTLVERGGVTVERIVSTGQASPPGFWYDSPRAEWVVLLSGAATLEFDGESEPLRLRPGDHVLIEAHRRHRVAWTSETEPSIWLAVHYPPDPAR